MSSILTGFAVIMMEAGVAFYKRIHAINFGVYGATMVVLNSFWCFKSRVIIVLSKSFTIQNFSHKNFNI